MLACSSGYEGEDSSAGLGLALLELSCAVQSRGDFVKHGF